MISLGGRMHFAEGGKIIAAVEQSVRRLVQEAAADSIPSRRLPDVWRRVLHVGGDYF